MNIFFNNVNFVGICAKIYFEYQRYLITFTQ